MTVIENLWLAVHGTEFKTYIASKWTHFFLAENWSPTCVHPADPPLFRVQKIELQFSHRANDGKDESNWVLWTERNAVSCQWLNLFGACPNLNPCIQD